MTIINQNMRNTAIMNLRNEINESKEQARAKEEDRLARAIYNKIVPAPRLAKLKELPKEYFYHSDTIRVCVDGNRVKLAFQDKKVRPLPAIFRERVYTELPDEYGVKLPEVVRSDLKAYKSRVEADKKELREILHHAMSVLACVRTMKQLREAWPEGERLLPKVNDPTNNNMVVRVGELNKRITQAKKSR